MLVGVTPFPPSCPPSGTYLGILHYKQAKLRKDMQHSVLNTHMACMVKIENWMVTYFKTATYYMCEA